MIRAAFVPYDRGRAFLLIADGAAPLVERYWDLGCIVCLVHVVAECDACMRLQAEDMASGQRPRPLRFRREVAPEEAAGIGRDVAAACKASGVGLLLAEVWVETTTTAQQGAPIGAAAMAAATAAGVRAEPRPGRPGDARARALGLLGVPTAKVPRTVVEIAGGPGAMFGPTAPSGVGTKPPLVLVGSGGGGGGGATLSASSSPPPSAPLDCALARPRLAGIDPGSRWLAVVVGELDEAGALRLVARQTFAVGRVVERRKPKTIERKGSTYALATRYVCDDADVEAALQAVGEFLAAHGVRTVAVERAMHFRSSGDSITDGARAASLLRSETLGSEVAGCLRALGATVRRTSSATWRRVVKAAAKLPPTAATPSAPAWRSAVLSLLPELTAADAHQVDAGGILLWLDLETRPKPAKGVRDSAAPSSLTGRAKRTATRLAARAALGCTCAGRRYHAATCPANPRHKPKEATL